MYCWGRESWTAYYSFVFNPQVMGALNGIAWWSVMLFVMIAGIELDLKQAWAHRRESTITALLLMAITSTMLTVPVVYPKLQRVAALVFKSS